MPRQRKVGPPPAKAKKMLRENRAQGRPLTDKERRFLGARASGQPVRKPRRKRAKR